LKTKDLRYSLHEWLRKKAIPSSVAFNMPAKSFTETDVIFSSFGNVAMKTSTFENMSSRLFSSKDAIIS
jgi:hypothetical protein